MLQHFKTDDEPLVIRDAHTNSVVPIAQYRMIHIFTVWKNELRKETHKDNNILIKSDATTFPDNRIHALKSIT